MSDKHKFGSKSTNQKLDTIESYLHAYATALKNQSFGLIYIDAFAGTGSRTVETKDAPLVDRVIGEHNLPGSARRALAIPFDSYLFVEKSLRKYRALEELVKKRPDKKISIRRGDANEIVERCCNNVRWHQNDQQLLGYRGVVFLDPYGMHVSWNTLRAIAKTEALDCWYYFPIEGAYRNAPNNPNDLNNDKIGALNYMLGTDSWQTEWYPTTIQSDLFAGEQRQTMRVDIENIEAWVKQRLGTIFQGWVSAPLRLHNDRNAPIASLFLCVSNPNPKAIGLSKKLAGKLASSG